MPSFTRRQARFMRIAAKSKKFAAKAGIPPKVAKEYHAADKRAGKYTSKKK